jgi:hypothetical protein
VVCVRGVRRKRPSSRIIGQGTYAIGGQNSFYARCIRRKHQPSGNQFQLKYGVMRPYRNLSPFVLTMLAGELPVTCADLLLVLDGLFRRGYKATVSSVEVTFDTEGSPLEKFAGDLCSRAEVNAVFDEEGREKTIYCGKPRSAWGLRLYEKTDSIVRAEFILRSVFLRSLGIRKPQELLLLRKAPLWRKVRFRKVDQSEGYALPRSIREVWAKYGRGLPPPMQASIIERALRSAGVNPRRWVVSSSRERLLRRMQTNLIC